MATIFGVNKLPGDVYVNLTLIAVFDAPALIVAGYLINRIGRVNSLVILYTLCFITMYSAVPLFSIPGLEIVASFLTLFGRSCTTATGSILVIITTELGPTTVRNRCVGLAQGTSLVLVMAGPYISIELTKFWEALPTVIFGSIALVSAFTVMLLPETKGKRLPDTIAEAEKFGTGKMFPWCRKDTSSETVQPQGKDNEGFSEKEDENSNETEEQEKDDVSSQQEKKRKIFTISKVPVSLDPAHAPGKRNPLPSTSSEGRSSDSESGNDSAYDSYQAVDGKALKRKMKGIAKIISKQSEERNLDTEVSEHKEEPDDEEQYVDAQTENTNESEDEVAVSCVTEWEGDAAVVSTRL